MQPTQHYLSQSSIFKAVIVALVLVVLVLAAISPLLSLSENFPKTHDGQLHLYRLIALDYSVQHGDLWPRFVPGLIFGYGSPIFNYYAPSSLYVPELLYLLGLSFKKALLFGMAIYTVMGMAGAFLLGSSFFRPLEEKGWKGILAGLGVAVAYTYAPYNLYNLYVRGAVAEIFALSLLPWVLWGLHRIATSGLKRDYIFTVILFALFIPIHNITTLNGMVLLVLFCVYLWLTASNRKMTFVRLVLTGLIAVGLTTFFWLPALGEINDANLSNASEQGIVFFAENFQDFSQTFALPPTADPSQMNASEAPRSLSWPQLAILAVGVSVFLVSRFIPSNPEQQPTNEQADSPYPSEHRAIVVLFACAVLFIGVLVFLTTRASTWIWDSVPMIHYTQFPWRLLGQASMILAILVGISTTYLASRIRSHSLQALWIAICLAGMIIYAMPWLYVQVVRDEVQAETIADAQNFERESEIIATGSWGEFIPVWATELPDPDRLTPLYDEQDIIPRLNPDSEITLIQSEWGITSANIEFEAVQSTTIVFDWLYFPGWRARLNDEDIPLYPLETSGLIAIDVPAGISALEISMGPTSLRSVAAVISLLSLALGLGLLFISRLWEKHPAGTFEPERKGFTILILAAICGVLLFTGKVYGIDQINSPIRRIRFSEGVENGVEVPILTDFAQQITLIGIDLPQIQVSSGESLSIDLYWQLTAEQITENHSSIIYVYNAEGTVVLQKIAFHPGDHPTSEWIPGSYIQEQQSIEIPDGTPPGQYAVHSALYSHHQQTTLAVFSSDNRPLGVTVKLTDITITRPEHPVEPADLELNRVLDAPLNNTITLLGSNDLPASAEVGQPFDLALYFETEDEPTNNYDAQLLWLTDGQIAAASPIFSPITGYPTDEWLKGDVWLGNHVLTVPGRLESGYYDVALQLVNAEGERIGAATTIGLINVSVPDRRYEQPDPTIEADIAWENGLHLEGYDLPFTVTEGEEVLNLAFYWQTDNDIFSNLKFFVHLLNEEGEIVTQVDRIPVDGTRPTAGWSPEEFITDSYQLLLGEDLSPGPYTLRIGWYDPNSTFRVALPDGSEFWLVPDSISLP